MPFSLPGIVMGLVQLFIAPSAHSLPSTLPGISRDNLPLAVQTYLHSCDKYRERGNGKPLGVTGDRQFSGQQFQLYQQSCQRAHELMNKRASHKEWLTWLDQYFVAIPMQSSQRHPMLTAYYEPSLPISKKPTSTLSWPIYALPAQWSSGQSPDRQAIESGKVVQLRSQVLYYTDRWSAFVLQVQGSGTGVLANGDEVRFVYAGTNNLPYTSIGKVLVDRGEISKEEISMQTIKAWMATHTQPEQDDVYWRNKRMVFFSVGKDPQGVKRVGPPGAMNLTAGLTPYRSAALDWQHFIPGLPVFVSGTLGNGKKVQQLVIGQDRGAAITSNVRMDLFIGAGNDAEELAGLTQDDQVQLWRLELRTDYPSKSKR